MSDDYYTILNVSRTANEEEIKRAFRKEAFKYHPDRNPNNPSAEERFKKINEAYSILSDKAKRQAYDHGGVRQENPFYQQWQQTRTRSPFTDDEEPFVWRTWNWNTEDFRNTTQRRTNYSRQDAWKFIGRGLFTIAAAIFTFRFLLVFHLFGVFIGILMVSHGIRLLRQGIALLAQT